MADILAADRPRIALVSHLVNKYSDGAKGLTVLDLACRTGAFSYALATQGHFVTGVEGRHLNLKGAQLHPNIEYVLGDVRNIQDHPEYDVTLCLGLLYHLTAQDALNLLRQLAKMTRQFVILDTHVSFGAQEVTVEEVTYFGHSYPEPEGDWSSIGNDTSWWFTEASLMEVLRRADWRATPIESPEGAPPDRRWYVLIQKDRV